MCPSSRTAWEQVAQAMWRRYPNPFSKHVLSEDTLSRFVVCHCVAIETTKEVEVSELSPIQHSLVFMLKEMKHVE